MKNKTQNQKRSSTAILAVKGCCRFVVKPFRQLRVTCYRSLLFLSLVTCHLLLSSATFVAAAIPQWWIMRGVINTNLPPDNYAAVNQGQLKHIAYQAALELEDKLPGGMGYILEDLVSGFVVKTNSNYYPVNGGQLKNIAKPFYDRLIEEGYAESYPWTETKADDANYALVNIGQVKNVFSFDLDMWNPNQPPQIDSDEDGLPDAWEIEHFGDLTPQPDDDPDNDGIPNSEEEQDEADPNNPEDGEQKSSYGIVSVGTGQWASQVNKKGTVVGVIQEGNNLTYYTWNKGEMKIWPGYKVEDLNDEGDILLSPLKPFVQYPPLSSYMVDGQTLESVELAQVNNPQVPDEILNEPNLLSYEYLGTVSHLGQAMNNKGEVFGIAYTKWSYTTWWLDDDNNYHESTEDNFTEAWPVYWTKQAATQMQFKEGAYWFDSHHEGAVMNDKGEVYSNWAFNGYSEDDKPYETIVGYWQNPNSQAKNVDIGYVSDMNSNGFGVGSGFSGNWDWKKTKARVVQKNNVVETLGLGVASSINGEGTIVGSDVDWTRAYMWQKNPDTQKYEKYALTKSLGEDSEWKLTVASDINDHGVIVGQAVKQDQQNALVLFPSKDLWMSSGNDNITPPYRNDDRRPSLKRITSRLTLSKTKPALNDILANNNNPNFQEQMGQQKAILLIPAELGVDANRDGKIVLLNEKDKEGNVGEEVDQTKQGKYFRFWRNDDDDQEEEDKVPANSLDKDDSTIDCPRDLEDFTRLWVYLKGVHEMVKGTDAMLVGLKWKDVSEGSPAIRLYEAVENDGGVKYLKEESIANQQLGGKYGNAIEAMYSGNTVLNSGEVFILPSEIWDELDEENYKKYFLFEGVSEGKGKLQLVFLDQNQNEIGEAPPIYLEIKNIKKMYERGKAMPDSIDAPYNYCPELPPNPNVTFVEDPNGNPFEKPWDETGKCVVFVHGWNPDYNSFTTSSETVFKRLWHQGFKGRFAAFHWHPLEKPSASDPTTANPSEYRAWKYGKGVKDYVTHIKNKSGYPVNLISHSLGNVAASEALKLGLQVNNFAVMQGALPAGCFDSSGSINNHKKFTDAEKIQPTPDWSNEANPGYRNYLGNVSGNLINFYNKEDFALVKGTFLGIEVNWERNQELYHPDDPFGPGQYHYTTNAPVGEKAWLSKFMSDQRFVTQAHESMSYVARSRSQAVGAVGNVGGAIDKNINVGPGSDYNFGDTRPEHSAQFNRPIQQLDEFYKTLGKELEVIEEN